MEVVDYHKDKGIATVTLNRPSVYNAVNRQMALDILKALDVAGNDPEIRTIVLTGRGKGFCTGQDLKDITEISPAEISRIIGEQYSPIVAKITHLEKPVLAAVNGVAAGAGMNIALACDIVVARESAQFVQGFGKIGLIPDAGGTYFLPRLIGLVKARAFTFLSETITAKEAEMTGLIYKSVPDGEFDEYVRNLSVRLAQMATRAIGLTKKAFLSTWDNNLDEQLVLEEKLQASAGLTKDTREGVEAFLEKRPPEFKGH
jgi:2-(1,2-epoxy-1,2-dihydrophenyl)acetyl-CoA isomerase